MISEEYIEFVAESLSSIQTVLTQKLCQLVQLFKLLELIKQFKQFFFCFCFCFASFSRLNVLLLHKTLLGNLVTLALFLDGVNIRSWMALTEKICLQLVNMLVYSAKHVPLKVPISSNLNLGVIFSTQMGLENGNFCPLNSYSQQLLLSKGMQSILCSIFFITQMHGWLHCQQDWCSNLNEHASDPAAQSEYLPESCHSQISTLTSHPPRSS